MRRVPFHSHIFDVVNNCHSHAPVEKAKDQQVLFGIQRHAKFKKHEEVRANYCVGWEEFLAHESTVNCLALGRKSGRVMVTGGEDRKVNLWAVGRPNCIMSLNGHTTAVMCVKFGRSEDTVCAGSVSGSMKLWDLEATKILRTLTGHKSSIKCVDFHPYGEFIVSGSQDNTLKLWDMRRKGCIRTYKGHNQAINSLKFSPDGRWIASGGGDGVVKLWDLPSGEVLTEFIGHTGSIAEVEFHPNEFLLASGSSDRSVKFWDLENFQLISSTGTDSGPVRCISFNPDGECLFSGAQDVLKVYGWEPAMTYDTLVMGWGKVTDVTMSQQQLIAGTISLTSVSVYIVDLKRVQPLASCMDEAAKHHISKQTDLVHSRLVNDKDSEEGPRGTFAENCNLSDGIIDTKGYPEICNLRKSYYSQTFESAAKVFSSFIPPGENSYSPILGREYERSELTTHSSSLPSSSSKLTSTPVQNASSINLSNVQTASCDSFIICDSGHPSSNPVSLLRTSNYPSNTSSSATISVVRPVAIRPEKATQQAIVFPKHRVDDDITNYHQSDSRVVLASSSNIVEFVPDQRDRPVGLELEEFLPRHLQNMLSARGQVHAEMSEAEAMSSIIRGHQSMMTVLQHRCKNLHIVFAQWSTKDAKTALDTAVSMNDTSVIVDILNVITLRPQLWSLDLCQVVLPTVYDLLQNRFETYMSAGCSCLKLILKNFASLINSNIAAPPGVGVDISREERYNKCVSCYHQLLSIRAFLLKRQTLSGKLGQSFRELQHLMRRLD
ncbi:katanin p80 WD40 repeat-containing subunit B1-like isoform X3 [Tachypleus tridentatus]|uniref:katanin p80 WD40 repeat-containing subunit B1-like isoform X3 n=1 Tax=Tachypleus tridentatus TaxID=6853 RepID=UPI003FD11F87